MSAARSLWLDDGPVAPRAPLDGDRTCEVCVVGAGIGGIALARRLSAAGADVLVLEAGVIGGGATGRNGGFFISGAAPPYDRAVAAFGNDRARRIHAATLAAQGEMLAAAAQAGAADAFAVGGLLWLAMDDAEAGRVRAHHAALRADGFAGELLATELLPAALRRPGRIALLTPGDGVVHPVRWLRALAAGLPVCEGTRVVAAPAAGASGVTVRTDRGTVRCDRVVVAADAALGSLVDSARAVRARRLQMLATAPLAPGLLDRPVYTRDGHEYAQQRPDGRVTLGGFSDVDGDASWTADTSVSAPVQARLERWLTDELGVRAEITHRWSGVVGYAPDALPRVGAAPGSDGRIWGMGGYNGTGHVQAWVAARIVAAALTGTPGPDAELYAPLGT